MSTRHLAENMQMAIVAIQYGVWAWQVYKQASAALEPVIVAYNYMYPAPTKTYEAGEAQISRLDIRDDYFVVKAKKRKRRNSI